MAKLFVISDVHGFYDEMIYALEQAGFDPNNDEHFLISCGDELDRGRKPQEVIDYLMSLQRKIIVKGNHTTLLEDMLVRKYAKSHDLSNGTMQTVLDLAPNAKDTDAACSVVYHKTKDLISCMVNYFETENYIFVHSFVPLKCNDNLPKYYIKNRKFEKDPDWRNAHESAWEEARWGNPFELAEKGLLPDKTLVFGHFHTSWPRHKYEGEPEFGDGADFSVYYGDGYIALDSCVAYSGKLNCLVLEDEFI